MMYIGMPRRSALMLTRGDLCDEEHRVWRLGGGWGMGVVGVRV